MNKFSPDSQQPKPIKVTPSLSLDDFRAGLNSVLDLAKEDVDRNRLVERTFQIVHELAKNIAMRANERLAAQIAKETAELQKVISTTNLKSEIDARIIRLLSAHNIIMTNALKEIADKAANPPLLGLLGWLKKIRETAQQALVIPDIDPQQEDSSEKPPESP